MVIIGKDTKDKGTQLEKLCKKILEILGYQNCTTNSISFGGEEIDIIADFNIPTIRSEKRVKTICECKAYKDPIGMTQWLKFLGKIYTQEQKENTPILGCLIALNGVNGNVDGHYKELSKKNDNLSIIDENDVNEIVVEKFKIAQLSKIINNVSYHTNKKILKTDILYYDNNFYWKIFFPENRFTLLDNNGNNLKNKEIIDIHKIKNNDEYISLKDELEKTKAKHSDLQKFISEIFTLGEFDLNTIPDNNEYIENLIKEHGDVLLRDENIIKIQKEQITKIFMANIINNFIDGYIELENINKLYDCELFKDKVEDLIIDYICEIQNNLELDDDQRRDVKFLILNSISAMKYSINPDPLIVNQIKQYKKGEKNDKIEKFRKDVFIRTLFDKFNFDFETTEFRDFFYKKHGIVEVETIQKVFIKSKKGVLCQTDNKKRIAIGELSEKHGGGLIPLLVLDEAPEPWKM